MRRRLTFTIVGAVAVALVVSGLVSLLLAARSERRRAESEVTRQAVELATDAERLNRPAGVQSLARVLHLSELGVVRVGPRGAVVGALPSGISATDLQPKRLLAGAVVHGRSRRLVFAAAPLPTARAGGAAVIATRNVGFLPGVTGYFLLSSILALALAAVVGNQLGRLIARPLQDAETATRRIADGDLSVSVAVPSGSGPELASLAASINTMAANLARSRGLERQFLLSVSHDLRTPLTSIRGFAEAIADGAATDTHRAAEVIASESRRLERLVGDLLDLAKLESRSFTFALRPVDAGEVMVDTAESFGPAAQGYGLVLDLQPPAGEVRVTADPDRLAQVVANLVENALKFASSRILVRCEASLGGGRIVVEDDGPGIAPDDLPRVFERLYTTTRTPARQVGSGLGLAIVAELVSAMGGSVRAESPAAGGSGTRVIVTLPA